MYLGCRNLIKVPEYSPETLEELDRYVVGRMEHVSPGFRVGRSWGPELALVAAKARSRRQRSQSYSQLLVSVKLTTITALWFPSLSYSGGWLQLIDPLFHSPHSRFKSSFTIH